jgi:hypothetical protein
MKFAPTQQAAGPSLLLLLAAAAGAHTTQDLTWQPWLNSNTDDRADPPYVDPRPYVYPPGGACSDVALCLGVPASDHAVLQRTPAHAAIIAMGGHRSSHSPAVILVPPDSLLTKYTGWCENDFTTHG